MQLDRLMLALRPRTDWEAADLGMRLAQRHAAPAMAVWYIASAPWMLLFGYLGVALNEVGAFLFAFWWFKPMFERPVLHVFSRAVFGDVPARSEWPGIAMRQPYRAGFLGAITWRRLELSRAFNLPVRQLERLSGSARSRRLQVLHLNTGATALTLTLLSFGLVLLFAVTLLFLLISLTLQQIVVFDPWDFEVYLNAAAERLDSDSETWGIVVIAVYWICEGLIAPFYVAAGFTLYLNRRTHLEAWDVELSFRQMVARRSGSAAAAVLLCVLVGLGSASPAHADETGDPLADERAEVRSQIEQIVDNDDFGRTTKQMRWVPRDDGEDEKDTEIDPDAFTGLQWLVDLITVLSEVIVWIGVAILLALILYFRDRWLPYLKGGGRRARPVVPAEGGLLLTPEELPDDIPVQVLSLWRAGQYRDALSLLYRGALTHLNERHSLALTASDTEGDCERVVRQKLAAVPAAYFAEIALLWQRLAYGHDRPDSEQVGALCARWDTIDGAAHE